MPDPDLADPDVRCFFCRAPHPDCYVLRGGLYYGKAVCPTCLTALCPTQQSATPTGDLA